MLRSGGAGWKSALDLFSSSGGCSLAGYLTLIQAMPDGLPSGMVPLDPNFPASRLSSRFFGKAAGHPPPPNLSHHWLAFPLCGTCRRVFEDCPGSIPAPWDIEPPPALGSLIPTSREMVSPRYSVRSAYPA